MSVFLPVIDKKTCQANFEHSLAHNSKICCDFSIFSLLVQLQGECLIAVCAGLFGFGFGCC